MRVQLACLLTVLLAAQAYGAAYINVESDRVEIGNNALARVIRIRPVPLTESITNKLTGRTFAVESEGFLIGLEGGVTLTAKDFVPTAEPKTEDMGGGSLVTFPLRNEPNDISVEVTCEIKPGRFWTRKWLTIHSAGKIVNFVEVERFKTKNAEVVRIGADTPGGTTWTITLGAPLFIGGEMFAGLEYPAGHNLHDAGLIHLRHYPGMRGDIRTRPAVLGVAPDKPNDRVRDRFERYIESIRLHRPKRFVLMDAYFNGDEKEVRFKVEEAKKTFADQGVRLDCILMDGGWTDPRSVMKIHPARPNRLAFVKELAEQLPGCGLGLHVISMGRRGTVDKKWLAEHFDMTDKRGYCMADPRVHAEFKKNMVAHVKRYGIKALKFDWGCFACEQHGHRGHLDGRNYAVEKITDAYLDCLEAIHKASPTTILYNTGWYSPWWLIWYDAMFSCGGDYNSSMGGPPSFTECDLQTTWRDAQIAYYLVERSPAWPLNSLMNHAPINWGWGSWKNVPTLPLDRFTDMIVTNYLRGTFLIEYYLNLSALDDELRKSNAAVMRWTAENDDVILARTRPILGDPRKAEVYGYAHFADDGRGIVFLRNPTIEPRRVRIELNEACGMRVGGEKCVVTVVYPYQSTLKTAYAAGDVMELEIGSWEAMVLKVTPLNMPAEPAVGGCRFELVSRGNGRVSYRILPPCEKPISIIGGHAIKSVKAAGSAVTNARDVAVDVARPAEVRVDDVKFAAEGQGQCTVSFKADVPNSATATVVVLTPCRTTRAQAEVACRIVCNGKALAVRKQVNANRLRKGKVLAPGWVLSGAVLPSGRADVTVTVTGPEIHGRSGPFQEIPFTLESQDADENDKVYPIGCYVLTETECEPGPVVEITYEDTGLRKPSAAMPGYWLRKKRKTLTLLKPATKLTGGAQRGRSIFVVEPGALLYTDRGFRIIKAPGELIGLNSIAFSHTAAKTNCALTFYARRPVRVYVAFGPKSDKDQWLDPQPGWQAKWRNAFECDNKDVGSDIYFKDFPAGKVTIFEGCCGNFALLGIRALK